MMTVLASGKAAPGVTATTWALALGWPREAFVVDADPGGGDLAAGLLAGRADTGRGLLSWVTSTRRDDPAAAAAQLPSHAVAVPEAPGVWLLPGLQHPGQATALTGNGWVRAAAALDAAGPRRGRDVLVDAGRLSDSSAWPVLQAADRVLLVCRPTARSIHAARNALTRLREQGIAEEQIGLLVIAGLGPYDPATIATELQLPLVGVLPADPAAAAVLSDGAVAGMRGIGRSRLVKAARPVAAVLVDGHSVPGASTPREMSPTSVQVGR